MYKLSFSASKNFFILFYPAKRDNKLFLFNILLTFNPEYSGLIIQDKFVLLFKIPLYPPLLKGELQPTVSPFVKGGITTHCVPFDKGGHSGIYTFS